MCHLRVALPTVVRQERNYSKMMLGLRPTPKYATMA